MSKVIDLSIQNKPFQENSNLKGNPQAIKKQSHRDSTAVSGPIPLKNVFRKNGIGYKLLDRTDKVALFEQKLPEGDLAGYEVCEIHTQKACTMPSGRSYPEKELTPSDEQFGYDSSKAFFPADLNKAKEYLISFTAILHEGKKPAIIPFDENGRLAKTVGIDNVGIPGLTSTFIERKGKIAIYKRSDGYYEVIKIKTLPEQILFGRPYPKREGYPGNEDFGVIAWCFRNENNAWKKYHSLIHVMANSFTI